MSKWMVKWVAWCFVAVFGASTFIGIASAQTLESQNFKFDESVLGAGGLINSNSANYRGSLSVGDTAVGNSASENFQTDGGSQTTADPTLSITIDGSQANFGTFSPMTAATATSTFSVSNYTSYGYAVQIVGDPPTNGQHKIAAMGTTDYSQTGIEQFGINLVANTSPESFGSNPERSIFGIGSAASNYSTSNQYRYVNGETIATAPGSSGVTTYTISYIVNVTGLTPGGIYTADQTVICTGTY